MGFLSYEQLINMGFKHLGKDVKISDKASIYGAKNIEISDFSRIDDFCVLSAGDNGIKIGKYVHIAVYCSLIGKEKIELEDFSGLSSKVAIYSSSDDYSGNFLTNPCVEEKYTNVDHRPVKLEKHVIVGVGSTILPGVTIGKGSAIGAYSLVSKNIPESVIAVGVPAKEVKKRSVSIFELENKVYEN
jgi:galactoside O-acetyltransferase